MHFSSVSVQNVVLVSRATYVQMSIFVHIYILVKKKIWFCVETLPWNILHSVARVTSEELRVYFLPQMNVNM